MLGRKWVEELRVFDVNLCVSDYTQAEVVCNLSKQLYRQLESIHWLFCW